MYNKQIKKVDDEDPAVSRGGFVNGGAPLMADMMSVGGLEKKKKSGLIQFKSN